MLEEECSSFRVMLVEDDDGFRGSLAGLLKSKFPLIAIEEAKDGAEAMGKLEGFLPHLIFMDVKLPGQNGLETTRRIKSLHPEIEVTILTNYDFPEYRDAARASGAYSFLSKGSASAEEIYGLVDGLCARQVLPII
ncbi:MAG: response regulator transcription factor [Deltaproteobacteria bacterium]